MKKWRLFNLVLLLVTVLFVQASLAQTAPGGHTLNLPEGAKARLGKGWISEIAYSPNGTRLAVGSAPGIWLYDTQTGEELSLLTGHTDDVNSVSFSPDGQTLASGSSDETLRLWDVGTGRVIRTLTGHTSWVYRLAYRLVRMDRPWQAGQERIV